MPSLSLPCEGLVINAAIERVSFAVFLEELFGFCAAIFDYSRVDELDSLHKSRCHYQCFYS